MRRKATSRSPLPPVPRHRFSLCPAKAHSVTHTSRCHQQLAADEDAKRSAAHLAVERRHAATLGVVPQRRVSEELARRRRGARAWDIVWYLHRRPGADVLSLGSSGLWGGHALPFWSFVLTSLANAAHKRPFLLFSQLG